MKEKENTKPINTHADMESDSEDTIDKTFCNAIKELGLSYPEMDDPMSPEELINLLKEDVVMVLERPGSWEGSKMRALLAAHGLFY